jgi:ADP-heptose:LPS heptosyltransferase
MDRHVPFEAAGIPAPNPLPAPGLGIAVINEREGLGDGFSKLPLLRALKCAYPAEAITWIVSEGDTPYSGPMAEIARPYVARILAEAHLRRPTPGAIARLRRLPPFSLVIDHRTDLVTVMTAKATLKTKLYQAASPGYLFCSRRPRGRRPKHKQTQLMGLLEAVTGCPVDGSGEIQLPAATEQHAAELLPHGPRYVGLAPGASSRTRCWPLEQFVGLAKWITSRGWHPVLLLGPSEQDLHEPLRGALPEASFPTGRNDRILGEVQLSLAIGQRLSAAVTMDTGMGHLLAEAGTPLVSLFGPSNPERWAPRGRRRIHIITARPYGGPEIARIPLTAVSGAVEGLMA